jgi:hypothetical protein
MRCRRLAASVWPTETDSTKPTTLMSSAGRASSLPQREIPGRQRQRRQALRNGPDDLHALALPAERPGQSGGDGDHRHRSGLGRHIGSLVGQTQAPQQGFSPLRTQNRKAVASTPTTSVSTWVFGS